MITQMNKKIKSKTVADGGEVKAGDYPRQKSFEAFPVPPSARQGVPPLPVVAKKIFLGGLTGKKFSKTGLP
jgi:hypothetical protein